MAEDSRKHQTRPWSERIVSIAERIMSRIPTVLGMLSTASESGHGKFEL